MPKYGGSSTRRKKARRHILVITALLASVLIGGGALVSNALQSDEPQAVADDSLNSARLIGKTEKASDEEEPRGAKGGGPGVERPTPTPTPTPTAAATEEPEPTETEEPEESQEPEEQPPVQDVDYGPFPTMDSTGPRTSDLKPSDSITTDEDGQVIEGLAVDGRIKIVNDDVVVRDVRINHVARESGQYALHIAEKSNGQCPSNVVIEFSEIAGDPDVLADNAKTVYGACPFTLRDSRIYDVGSAVRITNGATIEGNFIRANFYQEGSGTHRSGIGLNGGSDNTIVGNTIECEGPGCSGAFVMYGDFAPVRNILVENNLFNTTGSYCTYAGSLDTKPHPVAENVRYVGNQFGRKFFDTCGRYGPVAGRDSQGGQGFVWENNTWADTGEPVDAF
jgi:hypothetical protein